MNVGFLHFAAGFATGLYGARVARLFHAQRRLDAPPPAAGHQVTYIHRDSGAFVTITSSAPLHITDSAWVQVDA